jgi:hypothetical protein
MKPYQFVLAGLLGAGVLLWFALRISDRRTAQLEGAITQVRTLAMDERSAVAIVDFEASNPAVVEMMIGDRTLTIKNQRGVPYEGRTIGAVDIKGLFQYFPALGEMKNEPLIKRVRVPSGESVSGMVAARFEIPKHELDLRQELTLQIADIDGSVSTFRVEAEPPSPKSN